MSRPVKSKRNYKKEYSNYQGRPEQIKARSLRNQAHSAMEKKLGHKTSLDVDHKREMSQGGLATTLSNLQLQPASKNRSFPRTKSARRAK